jgi:hypothetical protein
MAGLVVFCYPQVLFEIPPITFTCEEYVSLHFVYGSFNCHSRAASVECKHCYPGCRVHTGTHLRIYIKFWGRLVPSHAWMQNMGNHCLKVTYWMQCTKTYIQCTQNMCEDWYCTNTSVIDFAWWCFLSSLTTKGIRSYTGILCKVWAVHGFRLAPWYVWGLYSVDCCWMPTSAA